MAEAGQTGLVPAGRAAVVVSSLRQRWSALPDGRRRSLVIGIGVVLAAALGMAWYGSRPDYRVLFSGLEGKDVAQVSQELGAAGISFRTTPDGGGVEVPAEMLDKARMEVAAKGMPQSGRLGFELFDKPNWVGSEFDEKVNYQRALEGELEHTIATLGVVRSARVHLVLPQQSLFASEERPAKASVVLKLKRASLPPEQVDSIRNLVAGAVENLNPDQVTLVDADGRVSLGARGRGAAGEDAEQAMEARLVAMLEPLAGAGNVRATVNVSYDEGTEERTDEVYDPTQTAVLSQQKSEQSNGGMKAAQGVPGTASNTPAASPAGAVQGSDKAAAPGTPPLLQGKSALPVYPQSGGGTGQSMKEESGTYAVTKHLVHTEAGPGRVRRLTAAVVVNDRMTTEGAGKAEHTAWKPRTTEEMHRLETLAQAAVGFDEKRGDQVVLQNVSFSSNTAEVTQTGPAKLMEEARSLLALEPGMLRTSMVGLVGLVLVWFVLKPVAGQMVATLREPLQSAAGSGAPAEVRGGLAGGTASDAVVAVRQARIAEVAEGASAMTERGSREALAEVAQKIRKQPTESTRLLETWITAEGEMD